MATTVTALSTAIRNNLNDDGNREKIGERIASTVGDLESQLLKKMSEASIEKDPTKAKHLEGEVEALKIKYQRATRIYSLFTELMRNAHELMMSVIRNMRIS